jgi:uncharacterized protein (DUF1778 family)
VEKTDVARLRLTPDEKAAFQEAASISGLSLSAWIRERLRRSASSELERAGRAIPFYRAQDDAA